MTTRRILVQNVKEATKALMDADWNLEVFDRRVRTNPHPEDGSARAALKTALDDARAVATEERATLAASPIDPTVSGVADLLHDKLCHSNHTDGCAWLYESWEKPGSARENYYIKADEMLQKVTADDITKVFALI